SRQYHLRVRVPPGSVDDEMAVARVSLVVGGEVEGQALVKAVWTDDVAKSTRVNRRVIAVNQESDLAVLIKTGVDALREGHLDQATDLFSRAVRLAHESANTDALERLATLVDIEDPANGLVRLRQKIDEMDVKIVETRSTRTTRVRK
ncbi:MAG TPA: hypothetical protein VKG43_13355, partial [Acidimicrobiales bacterium]|nr:hypothetical protein [Acidimicrobiales bacterium]